jgi:hypothetical protein
MDLPVNPTRKKQFSNSRAAEIIANNELFGIIGAVDNTNQDLLANSRFSNVGDDGRLLQYPLDLGTDSTHYMIFNIYETDGAEIKDDTEELSGQYTTHIRNQDELLEEADKLKSSSQSLAFTGMMIAGAGGNADWMINMAARKSRQADQKGYEASTQTISAIKKQRELDELDIALTNKDKKEKFGTKVSTSRVAEPGIVGKDSIVLYMPQKINSMNMIDYDLEGFATTKVAQEAYRAAMDGGLLDGATIIGGGMATAVMKAAGDVTSAFGIGSPMDVLKVAGRVAINPQKEMLFNAPAPRKYEFAFEFAPRNEEESEQVRNIIQLFKYHAFPSTSSAIGAVASRVFGVEEDQLGELLSNKSSTFYRMPAEFQFEYMHIDKSNGNEVAKENHYLNRAERCVLTEVNVDYSGAGAFQSFENGAPTHITLTLTFSEARLITQEHIAKGY